MRLLAFAVVALLPATIQSASRKCAMGGRCSTGIAITGTIVPVIEMTMSVTPDGEGGYGVLAEYRESHTREMRHQVLNTFVPEMGDGYMMVASADVSSLTLLVTPRTRVAEEDEVYLVLASAR